jgi:hypothetical protein
MTQIRIIAPSHWSGAIVNLDYSGLDDALQLNTFLGFNDLSFADCVDYEPAGIMQFNDMLTDCNTYTFKKG